MKWSSPISRPMEATLWQEFITSRSKTDSTSWRFLSLDTGSAQCDDPLSGRRSLRSQLDVRNWPWVAVLSRIEKTPQAATKVQEEEVQVPGSDLNSFFGKSDEEKLDLKSFDWQTLTAHHQREIAKARKNALECWEISKIGRIYEDLGRKDGPT